MLSLKQVQRGFRGRTLLLSLLLSVLVGGGTLVLPRPAHASGSGCYGWCLTMTSQPDGIHPLRKEMMELNAKQTAPSGVTNLYGMLYSSLVDSSGVSTQMAPLLAHLQPYTSSFAGIVFLAADTSYFSSFRIYKGLVTLQAGGAVPAARTGTYTTYTGSHIFSVKIPSKQKKNWDI